MADEKTMSNDETRQEYPVDLTKSPFIDALKQYNFVIMPNPILLGYETLSKDSKLCYAHLLRYGLFSIMNGYVDSNGNPMVFMSKDTLGSDMGLSRATIARYLGELRNHGLVFVKRRGQGQTDIITLYAPKQKGAYYDKRKESVASSGNTSATTKHDKSLTTKCDKSLTQYIKSEEIKKEEDCSASTDEQPSEPISGRDLLKKTIAEGLAKQKKERKPSAPAEPKKNANTLLSHFNNQYKLSLGGMPPMITGKERKQAKDLIEHYGYETVYDMVTWTLTHWAQFKKEKALDGLPTIGLIYGFRAYVSDKMGLGVQAVVLDDEEESAW